MNPSKTDEPPRAEPERSRVWPGGASDMDIQDVLIIVAADRPKLLAQLRFLYARTAVTVRADRRQGLGSGDRAFDRRTPRHANTDLRDHGFLVVHRWELR